jgi:anti-sigma factor RsiW
VTTQRKLKWLIERSLHLGGYGCSDTDQLLFEYVEGLLSEETRAKLEKHLSNCSPCVRYVDSYRLTIKATHDLGLPEIEMPLALQRKLREFIQENPSLR